MWNQANPEERLRSCSYRFASPAELQLLSRARPFDHQLASVYASTAKSQQKFLHASQMHAWQALGKCAAQTLPSRRLVQLTNQAV